MIVCACEAGASLEGFSVFLLLFLCQSFIRTSSRVFVPME